MRILVIEDEPKVGKALQEGLRAEDYEVTLAPTGEEGFFLASSPPFDLIVLDILLPGRDGIEVLNTLRKRGIRIPILVLTAKDAIEDTTAGRISPVPQARGPDCSFRRGENCLLPSRTAVSNARRFLFTRRSDPL